MWHKWFAEWSEIEEVFPNLLDFFADRLKVQQREAGVRHDLIDAVFALGGEDDLVRLLARVHALQAFVQQLQCWEMFVDRIHQTQRLTKEQAAGGVVCLLEIEQGRMDGGVIGGRHADL